MKVLGVPAHELRPFTVRKGSEPDWSFFLERRYTFFKHGDRIFPYPAGILGVIEYDTLANAFGLRPETILIEGKRYWAITEPGGWIMMNPKKDPKLAVAYNHPSRAAIVTGEPVPSLLRRAGALFGWTQNAAGQVDNSSQQLSKKNAWFWKWPSPGDETMPLIDHQGTAIESH